MRLAGPPDVSNLEARGNLKGLTKALCFKRDAGIRAEAAQALGRLGDPTAVTPLLDVLEDDDRLVRMQAALALGRIGDVRAVDALVQELGTDSRRTEALEAVEIVSDIGTAAVEPLANALHDQNEAVRSWAAEALIRIGDPAATGPLLGVIRRDADQGVSVVAERLDDAPETSLGLSEVTSLYRVSIGRWQDVADLSVIRACIESGYAPQQAAEAAARLADGRGTRYLVTLLTDPAEVSRQLASDALHTAGWNPLNDRDQAASHLAAGQPTRLCELDPGPIEPLMRQAMDWVITGQYEWLARGCVAMMLRRPESSVDQPTAGRAQQALDVLAAKYRDELDATCRRERLAPTRHGRGFMHMLFGDYAVLIRSATSTEWPPALDAVKALCTIETQTSTNVLHHLTAVEDLTVTETVDVPYDLDHPSGEERVERVTSFRRERQTAANELASRGNPAYDLAAYQRCDCWRLPSALLASLDDRFRPDRP